MPKKKSKITKEDISPVMIKLGRIIREARETKEMTQADVAFLSKLHPSYIGQLERGEINPGLYGLLQIAEVLGVSLADWVKEIEQKKF